jgi:nitrogen regulatory protein PII
MKLVVAVIPPNRLEAVQEAVSEPAASIVAVTEVIDVRGPRLRGVFRGVEFAAPRPGLRLEIAVVNETRVLPIVNAIRRAGVAPEAGRHACGDVLVLPLEECERIVRDERATLGEPPHSKRAKDEGPVKLVGR